MILFNINKVDRNVYNRDKLVQKSILNSKKWVILHLFQQTLSAVTTQFYFLL